MKLDKWVHNEQVRRFFRTVKNRMAVAEIGNSAVVISYYLLLSLFPLMIALGNILPFLNINPNTAMEYIREVFPERIYVMLEETIRDLLTQKSGSLLSVSALGTLWAASQSINAIQIAMNKTYGVEKRSNPIFARIVSFGITVLLLLSVFMVIGVFGLGQIIMDYVVDIFELPSDIMGVFVRIKWPSTIFVLLIVMSLIYYLVPNAKIRLWSVLPGAVFTTSGWMFLSQAFGLYARLFATRVSSYEIFGSLIVLMLWLNFAATVVILGGIINAVLEEMMFGPIQERNSPIRHLLGEKLYKFKQKKQ